MNRKLQVFKYVFLDWLAALIAWGLFYIFRKYTENPEVISQLDTVFDDQQFWLGILVVPIYWLALYMMIGSYRRVYRKSRLKELWQTIVITLIGVTFIFFVLILDDVILTYKSYYQSFLVLFFLQFFLSALSFFYQHTQYLQNHFRKMR